MFPARTYNSTAQTRSEQAQRLNRAVDRVLFNEGERALEDLLAVAATSDTTALCNRILRRATRLIRQYPSRGPAIIAARDRCVLAVYGNRSPEGWFSAWCDGSSGVGADATQSGLGVVLMNAEHQVVAEFGEHIGTASPLAAELLALEAAVRSAVAHEAGRLRVHTDCSALVHLWQEQRSDERLARLRGAAHGLRSLRLYLVPRRFNQLANRLARQAASQA